jgi:hypothetical protein
MGGLSRGGVKFGLCTAFEAPSGWSTGVRSAISGPDTGREVKAFESTLQEVTSLHTQQQ